MTHHTIKVEQYANGNSLHIKATDRPNQPINVRAVLRPFIENGYKLQRYITNFKTGVMHANLIEA